MQRRFSMVCLGVFLLCGAGPRVEGSPRSRRATGEAAGQQRSEIARLMGAFSWGLNAKDVTQLLAEEIRERYQAQLKEAAGDPLTYDRVHREMTDKIAEMKAGRVVFDGQRTPWDVSLVNGEYGQRNDESMVVSWGERDRRFFFLHGDRLWKIYIAFNADVFADKTFDDFAALMEARFGAAERKMAVNLTGETVVDHLAWPIVKGTALKAVDQTGFYGNFCLILTDERLRKAVEVGRAAQRGAGEDKTEDPLVTRVTREPDGQATTRNPNEDIVDRITGTRAETPAVRDTYDATKDGDPPATKEKAEPAGKPAARPPAKKQPKQRTKDPLADLDV